ncbi:hypothetical protein SAMN05216189_10122 [Pseudomonas delhiensis]|uniref:Uncharacterized protein n=1 Tax=Pseudomonas delhiensis TaxID=366289 RepID=A0A239MAK5_9PSED|nr:hypothetical protein [Pseudomonas delhiensis]SDJ04926.1 hypothetical protein SAMN05216189_10122 [Pseudomonas delhiensis]SNT39550.1 hypothetical protein SAMN06295949_1252 [Pseudomonas delhiensis]
MGQTDHGALREEVPLQLLHDVQQQLQRILGTHFTATLAAGGASHYQLSIRHHPSDLSLEHRGSVAPPFIEELFALAWRMKAMLESAELQSMDEPGPVRRLAWISELTCPAELQRVAASLYPAARVLRCSSRG